MDIRIIKLSNAKQLAKAWRYHTSEKRKDLIESEYAELKFLNMNTDIKASLRLGLPLGSERPIRKMEE
jgi:hypothetical protein